MSQISHITLFTTALCNLNCNYCYICKDVEGGLEQIDNDLANDFKNHNQIKQILDYNSDLANTVEGITLWGGEPFLHIDRFLDNIEIYFQTFKNLNKIDTSTNFTLPNQVSKIEKILDSINKYYNGDKKFIFDLQISIDGYEEMNDFGRGKGVTERFLNNFYDLLQLKYNHEKIIITCHTKPTLSKETFHFLQGRENIIKWYQFFDATLNWERTSEGYIYWYKQQIYLTFFALICEYNTSEQQNIELYLQNLLERFQTPKEAQKIRKEFYKQFIKYKENHILTFINESKL